MVDIYISDFTFQIFQPATVLCRIYYTTQDSCRLGVIVIDYVTHKTVYKTFCKNGANESDLLRLGVGESQSKFFTASTLFPLSLLHN